MSSGPDAGAKSEYQKRQRQLAWCCHQMAMFQKQAEILQVHIADWSSTETKQHLVDLINNAKATKESIKLDYKEHVHHNG